MKKIFLMALIFGAQYSSAQNCEFNRSLKLNYQIAAIANCEGEEDIKIDALKSVLKDLTKSDLKNQNYTEEEISKLNELVISNLPEKSIDLKQIFSNTSFYNESGLKEFLYQSFGLFGKNSVKVQKIDDKNYIIKYNTSPFLKDVKEINISI